MCYITESSSNNLLIIAEPFLSVKVPCKNRAIASIPEQTGIRSVISSNLLNTRIVRIRNVNTLRVAHRLYYGRSHGPKHWLGGWKGDNDFRCLWRYYMSLIRMGGDYRFVGEWPICCARMVTVHHLRRTAKGEWPLIIDGYDDSKEGVSGWEVCTAVLRVLHYSALRPPFLEGRKREAYSLST